MDYNTAISAINTVPTHHCNSSILLIFWINCTIPPPDPLIGCSRNCGAQPPRTPNTGGKDPAPPYRLCHKKGRKPPPTPIPNKGKPHPTPHLLT